MPRSVHKLNITDYKVTEEDGVRTYWLCADNIRLKVEVPAEDIRSHKRDEVLAAVNAYFLNSLRHLKHTGKLPAKPDPKEMNKWSYNEWGCALKPKSDPVNEFVRFV